MEGTAAGSEKSGQRPPALGQAGTMSRSRIGSSVQNDSDVQSMLGDGRINIGKKIVCEG